MTAGPGLLGSWRRRREGPASPPLPPARAASRVESYVYGNVLVLAALEALDSHDVQSGQAALFVGGTAVSTFVAHVLAVVVAHRVQAVGPDPHPLRDAIRDSVPVATSGVLTAAILALGWLGWPPPGWALGLAVAATALRLIVLGSVVSNLLGERSTWRSGLVGIAIAAAGLLVAGLKVLLAH